MGRERGGKVLSLLSRRAQLLEVGVSLSCQQVEDTKGRWIPSSLPFPLFFLFYFFLFSSLFFPSYFLAPSFFLCSLCLFPLLSSEELKRNGVCMVTNGSVLCVVPPVASSLRPSHVPVATGPSGGVWLSSSVCERPWGLRWP